MKRPLNSPRTWLVAIFLFLLVTPCFAANLDYVIEVKESNEIVKKVFNAHHIELTNAAEVWFVDIVWEAADGKFWTVGKFKLSLVNGWYEKGRLK